MKGLKCKLEKLKTIGTNVTAEIEEKRSKFIANIFHIENVIEAENIIKQTKKQYYDARHNCYAYIVKEEQMIKKSSDDGEPSGTAGSPILNVIEKNGLCNVLVIVTRYFGGILLGTGGLVRAYTEATIKAIEKGNIVLQEEGYEIEIITTYSDIEKLKYYCNKNQIKIINIQYEENVKCIIEISEKDKNELFDSYEYNEKIGNILKYSIINKKYIIK